MIQPLLTEVQHVLEEPVGNLIDGEEISGRDGAFLDVIDPATGQKIAKVSSAGEHEVDRAVAAARTAFDDGRWRTLSPALKEQRLHALASLIEENAALFTQLDTLDNGMPGALARGFVAGAANIGHYYAGWPTKIEGRLNPTAAGLFSYTTRDPIGVCAGITPWNGPLVVAAAKIFPALAFGNTIVLKPAEQTPLSATVLGRLCREAGIPDGVVNIVHGTGPEVGGRLVVHPGVDKIAFTGSTVVGRDIQARAAASLKRITLELGGKSPNIVFADADLGAAAAGAMAAVWTNSGQICFAGTRLLVERSIHDEFVEQLVQMSRTIEVGPGMSPTSQMGPLVSAQQFERVRNYIEVGLREGANIALGEQPRPGVGYFVPPTIFTGVDNSMRIAQEEIFGPVLAVVPFDTADDALHVANNTQYGLGAGVWTQNLGRAHRVAAGIQTGVVWVNTYHEMEPSIPFGGVKQSGYGKEQGSSSLDTYTQQKSVVIRL
jgi:phenylacetaldehyde dehydrogenase